MRTVVLASIGLLFMAACETSSLIPARAPEPVASPDWVESTLHRLTLREKVGQMFVIFTTTPYLPDDTRRWEELVRSVKVDKVSGMYLSIGDIYNFPVLANKLQAMADVPLLMTADFEWGAGMRIPQATTFPRQMAVAATRDTSLAYRMSFAIAQEAKAVGVHQIYSPDADVNNNPKNPVINTRSFGEDPAMVAAFSAAVVRGIQDAGLIATAKHFPGHGDTEVDTHLDLPFLSLSRARFDSVELVPFKAAIAAGVQSMMVAHIHASAYDPADSLPSTLSPTVVTDLLQRDLGFNGLIVTDAMSMRGVTKQFSPGEAAIRAVKAGNDMILYSPDVREAIDALVDAVQRGEIPEERIDRSVRKVLAAKQRVGLDKHRLVDINEVSAAVATKEHRDLAMEIARRSVTVLGNADGLLPLRNIEKKNVLFISFSDVENPRGNRELFTAMREGLNAEYAVIDPRSNAMEFDSALQKAKRADMVLCEFNYQMRSGAMTGFLPATVVAMMNDLVNLKKSIVGISVGNPYVVMDIPVLPAFVESYCADDYTIGATAEVLLGEQPASGRLPITIPGRYAFGEGVQYDALYVREGSAKEAGFDPQALAKVDTVVNNAIANRAFPGAVVLVARNGIIALEKAYGKFTYDSAATPMTTDAIFDLASVTKVTATTSAVMRLCDEGKIDLNDPVIKYIPQFGQNGKEKITLYNLMVHNSGLPAWRKFYEFCDNPECVLDSVYATPLIYPTGDSTLYSDLGLITMGKVIEKVTGTTLDKYCDSVFFSPLKMTNTMYNPPKELLARIVPTEVDSFWKKTYLPVHGRVHDENAATLGGVSGHAGLFSTAGDMVKLYQMEMNGGTYGGRRYIKKETIDRFTTRQSPSSTRGIGWDTRNTDDGFEGKYPSLRTFRHTGFTGTSVVIDPENKIIVIFLTNRVYPTRNNGKLFRVRPALHNAVYEALR